MMAGDKPIPFVSVVVPTYKRPDLLRRALHSVQTQTFGSWELIVSDDERQPGPGWAVAHEFASRDPRVRVVRNTQDPGQSGNLNHAMSLARGEWIKPLYDDDVLEPNCLERLVRASRLPGAERAVLVRSLADHYVNDRLRRAERPHGRPPVQLVRSNDALAGMYQEDVEIGMPTQIMVRTAVVHGRHGTTPAQPDAGVWMEPGLDGRPFVSCSDWWWFVRLLMQGDLLLVNEQLCQEHQGDRPSVTAVLDRDALFDEIKRVREALRTLIAARVPALPAPGAVDCMTDILRVLGHVRAGRHTAAARQAGKVLRPDGWWMFARWALRRARPARFAVLPRMSLDKAADAARTVHTGRKNPPPMSFS